MSFLVTIPRGLINTAFIQSQAALDVSATAIPQDATIPQVTEGVEVFSLTYAAARVGNILEIEAILQVGLNTGAGGAAALFKNGAANALAVVVSNTNAAGQQLQTMSLRFRETATDTTSNTFSLRAGQGGGGAMWINRQQSGGVTMGGVFISSFKITEYLT